MTTIKPGDGVLGGDYKVTITAAEINQGRPQEKPKNRDQAWHGQAGHDPTRAPCQSQQVRQERDSQEI